MKEGEIQMSKEYQSQASRAKINVGEDLVLWSLRMSPRGISLIDGLKVTYFYLDLGISD